MHHTREKPKIKLFIKHVIKEGAKISRQMEAIKKAQQIAILMSIK